MLEFYHLNAMLNESSSPDRDLAIRTLMECGTSAALTATQATDHDLKIECTNLAITFLDPLVDHRVNFHEASLKLGILTYYIANYVRRHKQPDETQDQQLQSAWGYFQQAEKYMLIAATAPADMPQYVAARADEVLAHIYDNGVGASGAKEPEKALKHRMSAAVQGWGEAQMNLGIIYYHDFSDKNSALEWMNKAAVNATLDEALRAEAKQYVAQIQDELNITSPLRPPPKASASAPNPN